MEILENLFYSSSNIICYFILHTNSCHSLHWQADPYPLCQLKEVPLPAFLMLGFMRSVSVQNLSKLSALTLKFLYFLLPFVNEA